MRKPLVSPILPWMAIVSIQFLVTALILGPLLAPISVTTALKLNGTTTTITPATPGVNYAINDNGAIVELPQTTIASFLQSELDETTLSPALPNQVDELTTPQSNISPSQSVSSSSSPLTKRHSSIVVGEPSSQNDDLPKYIANALSSASTENTEQKQQKNGIGVNATITSTKDEEQSSAETTAELNADETLSSKKPANVQDDDDGVSASTNNSLGSSSDDEDDSDTYFSSRDEADADKSTNEGDSGIVGGEVSGDTIFPPEDSELDTDESVGATTYASLLRPAPTTDPQAFSFSSQLANKLNRNAGVGVRSGSNRIGIRGLSSKSDLNSITTTSTTELPAGNYSSYTNNSNTISNQADKITSDSGSSAIKLRTTVRESAIRKNDTEKISSNSGSGHDNNSSSSSISSNFDLNGSSFQSRSNANLEQLSIHPQYQQGSTQLPRARPTSSVINNYNSNTNHNNNLHNRIIKRKKLPFGRNNSTAGSSLSSIYGNTILANNTSNGGADGESDEPTTTTTVAAPIASKLDPATFPSSSLGVSSTTETNSLLSTSQDEQTALQQERKTASGGANLESSLASISGNDSSNSSASISSSRAILGFGTTSSSSNHGKVKRPKPIIIRDRDESVYVNNLSENSAAGGGPASTTDETATVPGAGEDEESNKPVGSNALPTPPYKRRVKLTSRRVSTPTPRPTEDIVSSTPTVVNPSVFVRLPVESLAGVSSQAHNLMAEAASGATDVRHVQHEIRPSAAHENYGQPEFTSRRVFKEEFGITHNSYGHDDDDDDALQATTDFYSLENPTPYPIPMGVRTAPHVESVDNAYDPKENTGRNSNSGGNGGGNRYRDYYSEISSRSVESGGGAGNLHIQSDSHLESMTVSPVTVTVTHTVVHSTPTIFPSTADISSSSKSISHHDDDDAGTRGNGDNAGGEKEDSVGKGVHQNLQPTPALPTNLVVSSTPSNFEIGKQPNIVSHSAGNEHLSTSHHGTDQHERIQSSHENGESHKVNDQQSHPSKQGSDQDEKQERTPAVPPQIQPTPVVTSKNIKSVYFTQVEHPHYSSSSYEYTTSSMYSYSFPDHESMHSYYPDMMHHDDHEDDHDHHPHPEDDQPHDVNQRDHTPDQDENHSPVFQNGTTSVVDDGTRTTVSDGRYLSPSPTPAVFVEDSGNRTKSSSSQVPVTVEREGTQVTPPIDVDVYTPVDSSAKSKVEDNHVHKTTVATTLPPTERPALNKTAPGSSENEISEEEQRKQQHDRTSTTAAPSTMLTTKQSGGDGKSNKNKSDEDNEVISSSREIDKETANKDGSPAVLKTPFGSGESFGIGKVHVPVLVQIVLDVDQQLFCSHQSDFKRMLVTVYETEKKTKVDPAQIVMYTEPGCESSKTGKPFEDASSTNAVTIRPTTAAGAITHATPKGTFPLTSPPSGKDVEVEDKKKSRTGKDLTTPSAKNSTSLNDSSVQNKSSELLSGNKSSSELESTHHNKSASSTAQLRSRRSTKMGTVAGAAKNIDISGDTKQSSNNITSSSGTKGGESSTDNLLSVYFYVNNKNGSYDQDLTSSFVKLWNDSSRLTNVTDGSTGGNGEVVGNGNDGGNNSNEMFLKRVKKVGMVTASHLVSSQESSDENSGIIVAIAVASIVAICLFLLGVGLLIMRHRQSQTKFAKRCTPVTLDDYSLDNISVYNSFRRKQRLRGSKRSYTNAAFEDANAPSRPVTATTLKAILTDVAALETEFRAIPNIAATLDDIPQGAETKNRYANVIPMPDTRVLLTFVDDIPNSDYINANYVRGITGESKRYIITQGPLEDTIVDFWRMVWEQQIRVIYMLTDFAEGGIAKCAEYYPRSETIDCSQLHGDFQITLERRDISDNCITSYLVLKDMERNLRRDVVHFWYHSWPEKGVPASPKMTIDFLNRSKKFTKEATPILVHCSPGTGRSGTIVACDIAMREYDVQNKADIPRIVMKIRQDRAGAVQTKEQYIHVYDVLNTYVSRIGGPHLESI